jgi:RNA polymerase sigma factor (sigma-70 family)
MATTDALGGFEHQQRLIGRARRGDEAAFRELWMPLQPKVFAICRHLTAQHADAVEALQDTQLAVWRHLDRFEGRSAFEAWVAAIARNAANEITRRASRRPETPVAMLPERHDPAGPADGTSGHDEIRAALGALRREHREAVLLWAFGMSYIELSTLLGVPVDTVRVWVFRARRQLREQLSGHDIT